MCFFMPLRMCLLQKMAVYNKKSKKEKCEMSKKRIPEYRAESIKSLVEKRGALLREMNEMITNSKNETRALTAEEENRFGEIENEIRAIDRTVDAEKRAANLASSLKEGDISGADSSTPETRVSEERAFIEYIKNGGKEGEIRAGEQNITLGNNGAIIPTSISSKIIKKVEEICPIFSGATGYSVKGTLKVPTWSDADGHNVTVGFQNEFTEITADAGKFTSVDLTGYLAGALTLIGRSVINNSEIDVLSFVVDVMGDKIASFIEKILLLESTAANSSGGTVSGALSTSTTITSASATAITADELIDLQSKIPTIYQANACWTMNPETFSTVRKLKNDTGDYLLQTAPNIVGSFPYMLLGKPVYLSDNMPKIGAGNKVVLYGDYKGLSVNMRQKIEMQVLTEKYATKHAIGLVSWFEIDSKVTNSQQLATLAMKST